MTVKEIQGPAGYTATLKVRPDYSNTLDSISFVFSGAMLLLTGEVDGFNLVYVEVYQGSKKIKTVTIEEAEDLPSDVKRYSFYWEGERLRVNNLKPIYMP